jgi:hypothetical protein
MRFDIMFSCTLCASSVQSPGRNCCTWKKLGGLSSGPIKLLNCPLEQRRACTSTIPGWIQHIIASRHAGQASETKQATRNDRKKRRDPVFIVRISFLMMSRQVTE